MNEAKSDGFILAKEILVGFGMVLALLHIVRVLFSQ